MSKTTAGANSWAAGPRAKTTSVATARSAASVRAWRDVMVVAPCAGGRRLGGTAPIILMWPRAHQPWVAVTGRFGYPRRRRTASVKTRARIYLAGPLGFSEAGRHFHSRVLVPLVRGLGYQV